MDGNGCIVVVVLDVAGEIAVVVISLKFQFLMTGFGAATVLVSSCWPVAVMADMVVGLIVVSFVPEEPKVHMSRH